MTGITGAIVWLVIAIVFFVIEAATVQLVCIWFALGSLVGMIASFFNLSFLAQLVLFAITSVAVLIFGRPFLKDKLTPKKTSTNADSVIGMVGLVISDIDNVTATGRVVANGLDWAARSENDSPIYAHQRVMVKAIDGVKLIVEPVKEEGENT